MDAFPILLEQETDTPAQILDQDARMVVSFLQQYTQSPATFRTYSKECERFLLWIRLWKQKGIKELSVQDFEEYLDFLGSPDKSWCGKRAKRGSVQWRPFVGPLSPNGKHIALAAINSMMDWLLDAAYVQSNALSLIRQRRRRASREATVETAAGAITRYLDDDMWHAFTVTIESLPRKTEEDRLAYERAKFIAAMMYMLAPRAGEMEKHTMGSFREISGYWFWCVVGKGNKPARVPVPDDMLKALMRYRRSMGLGSLPAPDDTTPLLPAIRGTGGVTSRRLNQLLKKLFSDAANFLDQDLPHKAEKLRKASAHWMRHTSITAKVDSGMDRFYVQQDARHADQRTTQMYTHEEEAARHAEAQKHRLNWRDGNVKS